MISLTTLGTTDLRHPDGTAMDSVVRQPRRFALLVYLAVESRRGYVRRDRVLATFWPEVTTEHGRRSLSQALHYLRQSLGADTVIARGQDELRIDPGRLACDACAFLDAADAGDPEAALRLFTGEFLPGFYCTGVPDFEHWLEQQRTDLRRSASDCAWSAAERACEGREWVSAAAHARQAAELAGGDEPAVRRLMAFLAGVGDRAGALEAYDALARRLRLEYEAEPSAPTHRLATEIRELAQATSPDLVQPLATLAPRSELTVAPALADPRGTSAPAPTGALRRRVDALRSVVVTLVLMAGFIALWGLRGRDDGGVAASTARLLVEEPRGTAAPPPSLAAEVVRQLAGAEQIEVLVDGAPAQARADALELALRTTFGGSGESLRATLALVDRSSGKTVASGSLTGSTRTPAEVTRLAARIGAFARRGVGDELDRQRAELAGVGAEVLADFRRAQRQFTVADSLVSVGVIDVARLQLASVDSQLARVERHAPRWILPPIERAEVAYSRLWALYFPPSADERAARAALAGGLVHAERVIELDPRDARGHELRGLLHYFLWATAPADSVERSAALFRAARADLERATSLSRDASRAWNYLSLILFQQGDFAEAYAAGRTALQADEFMQNALGNRVRLFWSALEVGDIEGAEQWCREIDELSERASGGEHCRLTLAAWEPARFGLSAAQIDSLKDSARQDPAVMPVRFDAAHAVILARAGRAAEARALLRGVEEALARDPHLAVDIAWIHHSLGDRRRAQQVLADYIAAYPLNAQSFARSSRFADAAAPTAAGTARPAR